MSTLVMEINSGPRQIGNTQQQGQGSGDEIARAEVYILTNNMSSRKRPTSVTVELISAVSKSMLRSSGTDPENRTSPVLKIDPREGLLKRSVAIAMRSRSANWVTPRSAALGLDSNRHGPGINQRQNRVQRHRRRWRGVPIDFFTNRCGDHRGTRRSRS